MDTEELKRNLDEANDSAAAEEENAMDKEVEEDVIEAEGAEEEIEAEEAEEASGKKKKERKLKWAKAEDKVQKATEALETKVKETEDKYARLFAEFDNFRKRSEKEKTQRYDFGVKDIVEKILPAIDNFERGLAAVPEDQAEDSFVVGMNMTYKLLLKALEDAGVKPIEAVGQEFNPDFHNAVMHVDDPEVGDNIVVEEFQKGYTYKDHVVRYSMVKVAN
jgi:molecular chaperone GrpE